MRNFAGMTALVLFLLPQLSLAAELGLHTSTIFRFEERTAPELPKQSSFPATQFVSAKVGGLANGSLSLHISGWGRIDLGDKSINDKSADGDLTYGYLLYSLPQANGQLKAGRFFTYDTGTVEQVDGISARVDLLHGFNASAFGGKPVRLDDIEDNRGNFISGGRIGYRYGGKLDIGISALHEDGAWSRQYNPEVRTVRTIEKYRQMIGADAWIAPAQFMELSGRSSYDTVTKEIADQTYLINLRPIKSVSLTGEYSEQQLGSLFSPTNVPLTMFRPIDNSSVRTYGGSATYSITKPLEITAEYKQIRYRSTNQGDSKRYGFSARLILQEKIRIGAGYHRLDSDTVANNSYDEYHAYGMYDSGSFFASADIIAHTFKEPIYGKDMAFEAMISAGYRMTPEIALSGNVSYGKNPLMANETKGLFKLNYIYETKGAR